MILTYKKVRYKLATYKDKFYYFLALRRKYRKKVFVLGTPLHGNLGDNAIILAENSFLSGLGFQPKIVSKVDQENYYRYVIQKSIFRNDTVTMHGGGNMGDQWFSEELFRRTVLDDFPNRKILVFPQTIYYTDGKTGTGSFNSLL